MAERVVVLIVASGAAWEPEALRLLGDHPRIVVLKRCVDVDDLMAAATAGQADVAVVGLDAPGLDRIGRRPPPRARRTPGRDRRRWRHPRRRSTASRPDRDLGRRHRRPPRHPRRHDLRERRPAHGRTPPGRPGAGRTARPAVDGGRRAGRGGVGTGRSRAHHPRRRRSPPRSPAGGVASSWSTPTRTAGRSPSSSASSTRSPGCSPPYAWTPPASSSSASARCNGGSTST